MRRMDSGPVLEERDRCPSVSLVRRIEMRGGGGGGEEQQQQGWGDSWKRNRGRQKRHLSASSQPKAVIPNSSSVPANPPLPPEISCSLHQSVDYYF